jgi:hypothetical protein
MHLAQLQTAVCNSVRAACLDGATLRVFAPSEHVSSSAEPWCSELRGDRDLPDVIGRYGEKFGSVGCDSTNSPSL